MKFWICDFGAQGRLLNIKRHGIYAKSVFLIIKRPKANSKVTQFRLIIWKMIVSSTKTGIFTAIFLYELIMAHAWNNKIFYTFYLNFWWTKVLACLNLAEFSYFDIILCYLGKKWSFPSITMTAIFIIPFLYEYILAHAWNN